MGSANQYQLLEASQPPPLLIPGTVSGQNASPNPSPLLNASGRRRFVDVLLNGHAVRLQLDTASDITIISERLWQSLGSPTMQPTSQSATSACGGLVQLIGQLQCCVSFRGTSITAICYIT
nr:unnamed protein product [Spirometra erinaceieuropaei]